MHCRAYARKVAKYFGAPPDGVLEPAQKLAVPLFLETTIFSLFHFQACLRTSVLVACGIHFGISFEIVPRTTR